MALTGRTLRVAAENNPPDIGFGENFENPKGLVWEIFASMAKTFNFTYTLVPSVDGSWGNDLGNGTVTGMVGMTYRKEVDMALGPFTVTYGRSRVIEFSSFIAHGPLAILLPRPKVEKDMGNFLKPFPYQLWIAIFICLCLVTVLGLILEKSSFVQDLMQTSNDDVGKKVFFKPIWVMQVFTNDAVLVDPAVSSGKIYLGILFVANLFLGTAYCAVLTSLLAAPVIVIPVDSLKDLVEYGKIPWAIEGGTSDSQMFLDAKNGTEEVFKAIGEQLHFIDDCYVQRNKVIEEGMALICSEGLLEKILEEEFSANGTCSFYIARETFDPKFSAFIFPKGSPLRAPFNRVIDVYRESGILMKNFKDLVRNSTACKKKPGTENNSSNIVFTMEDLGGIFIFLAAGGIAAVVSFFAETLCHCATKPRD